MDKYLENLVSDLGAAINEAIQRSDSVSEIERIRATGMDVITLAIEVAPHEVQVEESVPFRDLSIEDRLNEISPEDRKFLRSLNIKFDSDE